MSRNLQSLALAVLSACVAFPAAGRTALAYIEFKNSYWQIFISDLEGGREQQLTRSAWDKRCLRSSSGDSRVLFRNNEGSLFALPVAGLTEPTEMLHGFGVIKDFDFTPAEGLLVSSYAANALDNVVIWRCSTDGHDRRLLVPDPYLNEMPRWLSSGFLFVKSHRGRSVLCRVETTGSPFRELFPTLRQPVADPAPSPDGQRIAFCLGQGAGTDLWIAGLNGDAPKALYAGPGLEAEPAWSPDGQWLFFATWDGKNFRLAKIHPEGSGFKYLSHSGADCRCPIAVNIPDSNS